MKPFKHHIDPYNVALETSKNDCYYIHITLITFSAVFFRAQQNPRRASSHGADHPGRNIQVPLEAFSGSFGLNLLYLLSSQLLVVLSISEYLYTTTVQVPRSSFGS